MTPPERRPAEPCAAATPQPRAARREERRRSVSPRGRGIERLAETLEGMFRARPPPRQAMDLPMFSGLPLEWLQFQTAMNETTQLYKISAAENVARLRNCLRGDAREAVSSLLATATDPAQIMLTLEQCYGAPEIVIDRAMEQIKKLPKPSGAAAELNAMAIKLQNIVVTIRQIDRRGYLNNPMLVREVVTKLSPHLTARWCDYAEEHGSFNEPEIMTMSRFLMREANRALRHAFVAPPQMQQKREEKKPAINLYRRAAAHTISEEETGPSVTCYDCKSGHELTRCSHFIKKTSKIDGSWLKVRNCVSNASPVSTGERRVRPSPVGKMGADSRITNFCTMSGIVLKAQQLLSRPRRPRLNLRH
jgi:hypothetical protein